jgi:glycosyltransferase involved in cell wall biosynthesis
VNPFHLITGEYPPQSGGVGHYTSQLAGALAAHDCDVHVWSPAIPATSRDPRGLHLHALPDAFGPRSQALLEQALSTTRGIAMLQYVPNGIGRRGANLAFCRWASRARRQGFDLRVMFHEPYFYFTLRRPLRNALALVQRAMAAALLRANSTVYVSTETWVRYLRPLAPRDVRFVTLPIPSTLPQRAAAGDVAAWRARLEGGPALIGHFGTYGRDVAAVLEPALAAVLNAQSSARALLVGHRSTEFAAAMRARHPGAAPRIHATGALPDAEAAAALQACDVLLQPYPDGVTTRRTSVMAGLALGVATATTTGQLTERVWHETNAAAMAAAGDAHAICHATIALLQDERALRAQAQRGRQVYADRFAIEHTVAVLLGAAQSVPAHAS